jgi:hypothetical protein
VIAVVGGPATAVAPGPPLPVTRPGSESAVPVGLGIRTRNPIPPSGSADRDSAAARAARTPGLGLGLAPSPSVGAPGSPRPLAPEPQAASAVCREPVTATVRSDRTVTMTGTQAAAPPGRVRPQSLRLAVTASHGPGAPGPASESCQPLSGRPASANRVTFLGSDSDSRQGSGSEPTDSESARSPESDARRRPGESRSDSGSDRSTRRADHDALRV